MGDDFWHNREQKGATPFVRFFRLLLLQYVIQLQVANEKFCSKIACPLALTIFGITANEIIEKRTVLSSFLFRKNNFKQEY